MSISVGQYWFISEYEYGQLANWCAANPEFGYTPDDFGFQHHVETGDYQGWYAAPEELSFDELEFLEDFSNSIDYRYVTASVQAHWTYAPYYEP